MLEDLFKIQTMGFRGEALASIAAVAQLEMETCVKEGALGTRLVIEGSEVKSQTPVSTPKGTKISVKNLFFNIPARRNFLKSNAVETKHILDEFQRIALAHPEIAFSLYQNDLETYQLAGSKLSHRIIHLLGDAYKKQLIPCEEATDLVKIRGYVGKPAHAKKTRGEQFFFVNQRFIKSAYLHHAVKRAFEGLLPQDVFPFYVLFIDIAPEHIDVNVHPTKTEIKFEDERMIYSILTAATKQALATHYVAPSIDFEQNINFNPFATPAAVSPIAPGTSIPLLSKAGHADKTTPEIPKISERSYAHFKSSSNLQPGGSKDWGKLAEHIERPANLPAPTHEAAESSAGDTAPLKSSAGSMQKVQLHKRYILAQVKSGMVLIDQCAAHERILYERFLQPFRSQKTQSTQALLFPVHISLNPSDLALVQEHTEAIRQLGFVLETFGKDSLIVTGCPVEVTDHDPKQLLEGLVEQFKWNQTKFSLNVHENLTRSLAKRACMPATKQLRQEEIDMLVDQLFACENPNYTSDGRKTFVIMTLADIEEVFLA
ncbi:MAG: DNA mismatch repair endonuclease MutL [Bacteroidota bacterium]